MQRRAFVFGELPAVEDLALEDVLCEVGRDASVEGGEDVLGEGGAEEGEVRGEEGKWSEQGL